MLDALQRFGGPWPQALRLPPLIPRVQSPWRRLDQWAAQESVAAAARTRRCAASLLFDAIAASSGKWTSGGTERE